MKKHTCYWVLFYSVLLFVGGLIGFWRKGSLPSLYMGSSMSFLLALSSLAILWRKKWGLLAAKFLTASSLLVFFVRYLKTGRAVPALFLLGLSICMFMYLMLC